MCVSYGHGPRRSTAPLARKSGLSSAFLGQGSVRIAVFGSVLGFPLAFLGSGVKGIVAIAACLGAAGLVLLLGQRRLGGFTGDVLGAAGVIGETAGLLVIALRA